jgi:hypothetical protein
MIDFLKVSSLMFMFKQKEEENSDNESIQSKGLPYLRPIT